MSETEGRQFVDTNVLVYAHDRSAGTKHVRARELLRDLWASSEGCLSIQVLQEFYVTITRKVFRPLTTEVAAQLVADLAAWDVHRPGVEDLLDAIRLQGRHQTSFWDAMILVSAAHLGCSTVWSEDLSSGQAYGTVVVRNPFA